MSGVFFDPYNGHKLERTGEVRWDGNCVYEDVDGDARVICRPEAVSFSPPAARRESRWPLKIIEKKQERERAPH